MHRKVQIFNSLLNIWSEASSLFHHRGTTWHLLLCGVNTTRCHLLAESIYEDVQAGRCCCVDYPVGKWQSFKLDEGSHWKPVQRYEQRCDVCPFWLIK